MKKWMIGLALFILPALCFGQEVTYATLYCLNPSGKIIPILQAGTAAPTNYPGIQAFGTNPSNQSAPLLCDASGNLIVTASGGTIAAGVSGDFSQYTGTTAIGPLTTAQLPIANQVTNPSTLLYIYPDSAYPGTPDGSLQRPFLSFGAACATTTLAQPYAFFFEPYGTDGEVSPTCASGATAYTVYGNHATLSILSGTLTVSIPFTTYDLNRSGNFSYPLTSNPSYIYGGSVNGSTTVSGNIRYHGTTFSGANVINVANNATAVFDDTVFNAGQIVSGGSGTLIVMENGVTMTTNVAQPNINMSAGGRLVMNTTTLTNSGTGPNVNCADGATTSAPNFFGDGTAMNNGISCGSAVTSVSTGTSIPSFFGGTATTYTGVSSTYTGVQNVPGEISAGSTTPTIIGDNGITYPDGTTQNTKVTLDNLGAAPLVNAPSALLSITPTSDILCASGNSGWPGGSNTSIAALAISNITFSSPTYTFTTATGVQVNGYLVGQTVQVVGTTGGTGNFNAQYTISGVTGATGFTATSGTATGTTYGSGGTVSMVCNNSADIGTGFVLPFSSSLTLPPMTSFTQYKITSNYIAYNAYNAGPYPPSLIYNGVSVDTYSASSSFINNLTQNLAGEFSWTLTALSSGVLKADYSTNSLVIPVANVLPVKYTPTLGSYPLTISFTYYNTRGISFSDVFTYSSGGTGCTNGTQVVTFTNGGGTGALGTILVSGNIPSGSVTVTYPGYNYSSVPTTGTVATCTGATTFTSSGSLGGAAREALRLLSFTAKQQ